MFSGKAFMSNSTLRFGALCFLACLLVGFAYIFSSSKPEDLFTHMNERGETCVSDFLHYYQAAQLTASDQRHLIYDRQVQLDSMNKLIAPRHIDNVFYMPYPPFAFVELTPLALFSKETAYYVWVAGTLVVGIICLWILNTARSASKRLDGIDFGIVSLGFVASASGVVAYALGQSSWILVGLYSIYFWCLKRNRPYLAGAALALSTFKPQYTILLMLPMISRQRWRAFAALFVVEALMFTAAGFVVGWENIFNYPYILINAEADPHQNAGGYYAGQMVSLRNILSVFHNQGLTLTVNALVLLMVAPLVWFFWQKVLKKETIDDESFGWAAASTFALTLLVSPHTHIYELVVLSCPAILTLPPLRTLFQRAGKPLAERIWCWLVLTFPIMSWVFFASPLCFEFKSLALLLLTFCITALFSLKGRLQKAALSQQSGT